MLLSPSRHPHSVWSFSLFILLFYSLSELHLFSSRTNPLTFYFCVWIYTPFILSHPRLFPSPLIPCPSSLLLFPATTFNFYPSTDFPIKVLYTPPQACLLPSVLPLATHSVPSHPPPTTIPLTCPPYPPFHPSTLDNRVTWEDSAGRSSPTALPSDECTRRCSQESLSSEPL